MRNSGKGTLVLFVRHGVTPSTGRVLPGRAPGLHLSEEGVRQAERAAERLAGVRVHALYSSPLERTQETAAPAASRLGLGVVVEEGLVECDFGEWTGAPIASLARKREWQSVQKTPSMFRFPGGESLFAMQARVLDALERLRCEHPGGIVACFSHADPIKAALTHALGMHLDLFQRVVVSPGSISAVWYPRAEAPSVLIVNSMAGELTALTTQ